MVCTICHDSLFIGQFATRPTSWQLLLMNNRPATLNCGHVFHKSCIQKWFQTINEYNCPTCNAQHSSKPIVLYIDIGKDDLPANLENYSAVRSENDKIVDSVVELLERMTFGNWPTLHETQGSNLKAGTLERIEGLQTELSHQSSQNKELEQARYELAERFKQLNVELCYQYGQNTKHEQARSKLAERCESLKVNLETHCQLR